MIENIEDAITISIFIFIFGFVYYIINI